jgi:hypothetical protein
MMTVMLSPEDFGDDEADDAYCPDDVQLVDMNPQQLVELKRLGEQVVSIYKIRDDGERLMAAAEWTQEMN